MSLSQASTRTLTATDIWITGKWIFDLRTYTHFHFIQIRFQKVHKRSGKGHAYLLKHGSRFNFSLQLNDGILTQKVTILLLFSFLSYPFSLYPTADVYLSCMYPVSKQPEVYEQIYSWRNVLDDWKATHGGHTRIMMTEAYANISFTMRYYQSDDGRKGCKSSWSHDRIFSANI